MVQFRYTRGCFVMKNHKNSSIVLLFVSANTLFKPYSFVNTLVAEVSTVRKTAGGMLSLPTNDLLFLTLFISNESICRKVTSLSDAPCISKFLLLPHNTFSYSLNNSQLHIFQFDRKPKLDKSLFEVYYTARNGAILVHKG